MTLTVDTTGAAAHLGLARNTLEKMRVTGDGPPFVKLGRAVRYRMADLESYLAVRVKHSTSEQAAA